MTQFRHSVLGFCAVLVLACAGCGEEPPSLDTTPSRQPSDTSETSGTAPPSSGNSEPVRHTGVVVEGTEPGCLLLDTGDARYLLVGGDRDQLTPQRRLTVTGVPEAGTPTTCMEGTPLRVEEVSPAESR